MEVRARSALPLWHALGALVLLLATLLAAVGGLGAQPVVLAPGEPLGMAQLRALLADRLPPVGAGERLELLVRQPALPLANRASVPIRLESVDWWLDPASGEFRAVVAATAEGGERSTLVVAGRLRRLAAVPVPRRVIPAGTRITAELLRPSWLPAAALPPEVIRQESALVGQEAYRRLLAGRPVRRGEVGPPRLVRRGETVTVVYRRGALELMLTARALEDGALGQVVRLVNPDSRRTLRARVVGPREAEAVGERG